jgi:hypothetical protein
MSAMYSHEASAIQFLLQGGERLPPGIWSALGVHVDVVSVCLHPIDVGDGNDVFAVELANDESLERRTGGCGLSCGGVAGTVA